MIRPSLLPKLAACPRFESSAEVSAAADRGTLLDRIFRDVIEGGAVPADMLPEDADAVRWAADTARAISGGLALIATEDELRVDPAVAGVLPGTADLCCPSLQWSADLKTGETRNYWPQQAAYALGFMERYFADEWTVHLFYCDLRLVQTQLFRRDSATLAVTAIAAAALDDLAPEQPCDYCAWCARRWTCKTRLEPLAWLIGMNPAEMDLDRIAAQPDKLGALLDVLSLAADANDYLRDRAAETLATGTAVPGYALQAGRKSETVAADSGALRSVVAALGIEGALKILGNVSGKKYLELCAAAGATPQKDAIQINHGKPFIRRASNTKSN